MASRQDSNRIMVQTNIDIRFPITKLYKPTPQNSANHANANVAPKLSLKATLSSIADLRSIPFTYFCIRDVGTILYPLEAKNYFQSASPIFLLPHQTPNITHLHPKHQHPKQQR